MGSYKNFQNNRRKYKNIADLSKRPANLTKKQDKSIEQRRRFAQWIYMYRKNIDVFCEFHFGVRNLHLFQKFWLYELGISENYVCIASRGVSKSFIIALFALAICTLYPMSEVVIAAKNKKQAGLIISSKIEGYFQAKFPNIAIEIKDIISNTNNYHVVFHNGSKIIVVPSTDGARGERSTFNIYEEFRLIDKDVKDAVLSEFLHPRQTPFLNKYPELQEEAREVYISSAGFKSVWAWEQVKNNIEDYYNGDDKTRFAFYDYLLSLKHGMKSKKQIKRQRKNKSSVTFSQEVENLFFAESENAFFTYNLLKKARKLEKCWYPSKLKKNEYDIKRTNGEIRILAMDVASSGKKDSDNSIITFFRLLPTRNGYIREVPYIFSFNGINSIEQTRQLKEFYYQWNCDYVILDVHGVGTAGIYDQCTAITKDEESENGEYPAWTIMNHNTISKTMFEDLSQRTQCINGLPCIYPITGSTNFNHDIANQLLDDFEKGLIHLLVDEIIAEDVISNLIKKQGKKAEIVLNSVSKQVDMLYPYSQTSELVNEMIALEMEVKGGKVKLQEASHRRKDRYTSLAYGNYFAGLMDIQLLKKEEESSWSDYASLFGKRKVGE